MKLHRLILITATLFFFCISCQADTPAYENQPFTSTSGTAQPGEETRIELEDGAAIVIPADSIESEIAVTIERNPDKIQSLPPLSEDVVQLGDFYNFEISDGKLKGPVDLIFPFDTNQIPDKEGVLVLAYPNQEGWDFVPIKSTGNKVIVYTDRVGDPLIGWHFTDFERQEEVRQYIKYCDPIIPVTVSPRYGDINSGFNIVGRLVPLRGGLAPWGDSLAELLTGEEIHYVAGAKPIDIIFNSNHSSTLRWTTQADGSFDIPIQPEEFSAWGLVEGINNIKVIGNCEFSLFGLSSTSEGYTNYLIEPMEETEEALIEPVEEPIPDGAVLLPDFIGQAMDEAIDWLEENGFGYTWINGSSTYKLGVVFDQNPRGKKYFVPHRTTVVLHRTNEHIDDPYGCTSNQLTPEERANCGKVRYEITSTFRREDCKFCDDDACEKTSKVRISIADFVQYFQDGKMYVGLPGEDIFSYEKVDINRYTHIGDEFTLIRVLSLNGLTVTVDSECLQYSEFKILKNE